MWRSRLKKFGWQLKQTFYRLRRIYVEGCDRSHLGDQTPCAESSDSNDACMLRFVSNARYVASMASSILPKQPLVVVLGSTGTGKSEVRRRAL